jgi:DNA-binding transcriptional MocR family regulator
MSVVPALGVISLARGIPSPDLLPIDELEHCASEAIARDGRVALNYGPPGGYAPLREWLAERHGVAPSQVLVTPGSLLGLNLLVAETVEPGTRVVVESPTYDRALHILRAARAEIVVDPRGGAVRYVLPTFHNPTGRTLALDRRAEIVDAAIVDDALVVEDDPYGLLRFEGSVQPTLHRLLHERGAGDLAVYSSSFSKSVAPGLRVGYLVLPPALAARVEARALATYVSPPMLPQAQLFEFLRQGLFEPHLARLNAQLRQRRDALVESLAAELPGAALTVPEGGYFLWVELPVPAADLLARAREHGVTFELGSSFSPAGNEERGARLAFSFVTPEEIREAIRRLARVLRDDPDLRP